MKTFPLCLFKTVLCGLAVFCLSLTEAGEVIYNPPLDPACRRMEHPVKEEGTAAYMWYPGQLAAHLQDCMRRKSAERCVYVGYPGKFNPLREKCCFRRRLKVEEDVSVRWQGRGRISCTHNGVKLEDSRRETVLKAGENALLFEVDSPGRLPVLLVDGKGMTCGEEWEASLDGIYWNGVESDSRYRTPGVYPDDDHETVYQLRPRKVFCWEKAREEREDILLEPGGKAVIDFFHLEVGVLKFKVRGTGRLTVKVGESMEEVCNDVVRDFEQKPLPVFDLEGKEQEIILPERALRYAMIESDGKCALSDPCFEAKLWPVDYGMTFSCDDPRLNALWNAGVATLHSSLHHFYLDGIKRDYLPWAMDAVISALAGNYLFGDEQISRNGISVALPPPDPKPGDLGIVDYPLHALIGLKHHYLRFGDLRTSLLYRDRIISMLDLYISLQDENGFISPAQSAMGFVPGWATLAGPGSRDTAAYGQMMLCMNFELGAYFARLWGEPRRTEVYEEKAVRLRESIVRHFWDTEKKAFINGFTVDGKKDERISHHAQYWAILAGIFPPEHYDHLFDKILPAIPYYRDFISYEKGYEFLAYVKAGRSRDIFPFLESVWGRWLDGGHTRFPENFSPKAAGKELLSFYGRPFGLSLCHGGNGVPPVVAVLHGLVGFDQSDAEPNRYSISPDLMHLQKADIRIPVKEGFITLNLRKTGRSTVELPENCFLELLESKSRKRIQYFSGAGVHEFACP